MKTRTRFPFPIFFTISSHKCNELCALRDNQFSHTDDAKCYPKVIAIECHFFKFINLLTKRVSLIHLTASICNFLNFNGLSRGWSVITIPLNKLPKFQVVLLYSTSTSSSFKENPITMKGIGSCLK